MTFFLRIPQSVSYHFCYWETTPTELRSKWTRPGKLGRLESWFQNLGLSLRHGLWTPNEAIFSLKSRTFGLGQTNWADKFWGIWGIFGQTISTHFATVSPLSMFSIIQSLFPQKTKPLYPYSKYLFGIGIWICVIARVFQSFSFLLERLMNYKC